MDETVSSVSGIGLVKAQVVSFKPEYGDNETANVIGLIIGLVVAIVGIALLRKNWIALKRK